MQNISYHELVLRGCLVFCFYKAQYSIPIKCYVHVFDFFFISLILSQISLALICGALINNMNNKTGFLNIFLQYWGLNSGPTPWATPPAPFCEGFFWDRVSQTFCPGWLWITVLLISASWVARITGMSHQCQNRHFFTMENNHCPRFHWRSYHMHLNHHSRL
jgi:hypothetical protein